MIEITTLFSGSSGNSTLIKSGGSAVLIDAGRNCKAVCTALNALDMCLDDLSAIFITHEHSDHISAVDVMMKRRRIPVHITALSAPELCRKPAAADCAVIHNGLCYEVQIGELSIRSFPLPHDSAAHVGYIISDGSDAVGVATDIGHITDEAIAALEGCRMAVIEANHDVEMLKRGTYPYYLKQRILSPVGHLSNENSGRLCTRLAESGTQRIMLAHLSRENNTPDAARAAITGALDAAGFGSTEIKVASPDSPITL